MAEIGSDLTAGDPSLLKEYTNGAPSDVYDPGLWLPVPMKMPENDWKVDWANAHPPPLTRERLPSEWFLTSVNSGVVLTRLRLITILKSVRIRLCTAVREELCECIFGESGCSEIKLMIGLLQRIDDEEYAEIFDRELAVMLGLEELTRER